MAPDRVNGHLLDLMTFF